MPDDDDVDLGPFFFRGIDLGEPYRPLQITPGDAGIYNRLGSRESVQCPNCHTRSALAQVNGRRIWPSLAENLALPATNAVVFERVSVCLFCHLTTTVFEIFADSPEEPDQGRPPVAVVRVWPPALPRQLPDVVPAEIRSLFSEGSQAEEAGALRGAAALYRAAVEQLCKQQGITGGQLAEKINRLLTVGVEQHTVDDLHEARLLGNWSIHDGVTFSAEEVADVADLIEEACHVLYTQPAERAAMRAARQRRRDGARGGPGT